MLKFQEEYSIVHQSFEDFVLVIFVLINDLYKKVAPESIKHRRNVDKALFSDSEIITIALCGELLELYLASSQRHCVQVRDRWSTCLCRATWRFISRKL